MFYIWTSQQPCFYTWAYQPLCFYTWAYQPTCFYIWAYQIKCFYMQEHPAPCFYTFVYKFVPIEFENVLTMFAELTYVNVLHCIVRLYYYGCLVNECIVLILVIQTFYPSSLSVLYSKDVYNLSLFSLLIFNMYISIFLYTIITIILGCSLYIFFY